jgi:hypothetical protein
MRYRRAMPVVLCMAVLGALLVGPVSGASASDASIKAVIKSYTSKIDLAEGHLLSEIGRYAKSGNPTKVDAALGRSIEVFTSLKAKIAAQSASSGRVKRGKAKFEKGLGKIVTAYRRLKTAFGEKKSSPSAAKAEAKKALTAVKSGRRELREGARLLT